MSVSVRFLSVTLSVALATSISGFPMILSSEEPIF
jgi:hypothetical protein